MPEPEIHRRSTDSDRLGGLDSLVWITQQQPDSIAENWGTTATDFLADLPRGVAPAEVRENDQPILELPCHFDQVIKMDVPVSGRSLLMAVDQERALDEQDFRTE